MNFRLKRDSDKPRRKMNLLLAWVLIAVVLAVGSILIIRVLSPDSVGNSVDDWLWFIRIMLLTGALWATVIVGIWAFCREVSSRQNFKGFIFECLCLASLVALFYAEEEWKGKYSWEKFKRQMEAKGENFDRDSVVPQPVPDDENFAMSPVWIAEVKWSDQTEREPGIAEAWYGNRIYSEEVSNYFQSGPISKSAVVATNYPWMITYFPQTPGTLGDWATARMNDLRPWQSYYRNLGQTNPSANIPMTPKPQTPAQDVLLALSKYDPLIERLRQDSRLPYSRFPIEYNTKNPSTISLHHLDVIRECAEVLELRAIAELRLGLIEKAMADVHLMLRLADASRKEPFLVSHATRIIILQIGLQPIYEGLANHEWSDSQLAELDSKLSKFDFLTDYKFSLRGEMIVDDDGFIDYLHRDPGQFFEQPMSLGEGYAPNPSTWVDSAVGNLIPAGWYYQNELHNDRAIEEFYLPVVDTNHEILSPTSVEQAEALVEAETEIRHVGPYNFFERCVGVRGLLGDAMTFAYGQNAANLARVAIGLERYRLAHGKYPDSLTPLVPQFIVRLPEDIIDGKPLHYWRTANGEFVLYSVGWNETDDGGAVVLIKETSGEEGAVHGVNRAKGDWVWQYPTVKSR
ncbi:MAG TPA: hypothetical protein VH280_14325 [Verrucomicrobiae bacterium]|jgi:hypothetical protein|nr:hypothetical protein [Verrucomicrobiae bacterium]